MLMKHALATALISMTFCLPVFGQAAAREAQVQRIMALYLADTAFSTDSLLLTEVVAVAQHRNSGVDAREWPQIKVEIGVALTEWMTGKGGVLNVAFSGAVSGLSDAELAQLEQLISDPVYRKFMRAAASPAVQEQLSQAVSKNLNGLNDVVHAVLARHGVKAAP